MTKATKRRLLIDLLIVVFVPFLTTAAFGIYSAIHPKKIVSDIVPEHYGIEYENVEITTSDGLRLAAWYIPSTSKESVDKAVAVFHGYPAEKGDLLPRTAFLLSEYNLLLVDFRYFGQSDGSYTTAGAKEIQDAIATVEYLKNERKMKYVGLYGFSMGGAVALMTADLVEGVDAVISEAAYSNLSSMTDEMYRYLGPLKAPLSWSMTLFAKVALGVNLSEISPERAAQNLDIPVLIVHSKQDKVIPFFHAERIIEALSANEKAEFLLFEDAIHGAASQEFAERSLEFLGKYLRDPEEEQEQEQIIQ